MGTRGGGVGVYQYPVPGGYQYRYKGGTSTGTRGVPVLVPGGYQYSRHGVPRVPVELYLDYQYRVVPNQYPLYIVKRVKWF